MALIHRFREEYFLKSGAHEKSMLVLASYLSGQYHEQDNPYIDESMVRSEFKRVLENKIKSISPKLKLHVTQNNNGYNELLAKAIGKKLNTEIDLQITDNSKNLIAAYELKSLCNPNKGSANDIYKDFHRLSLIKTICPDITTIFIIVGTDDYISDYFQRNKLHLPYKGKIKGKMENLIYLGTTTARKFRMPIEISENDYQKALSQMGVKNIRYRTSRRPYSLNMHAYSYEILAPEYIEIRHKIGEVN